jgi:hypothetical protein
VTAREEALVLRRASVNREARRRPDFARAGLLHDSHPEDIDAYPRSVAPSFEIPARLNRVRILGLEKGSIAMFRADCERYAGDPDFERLVTRLTRLSPEFARWWPQREVARPLAGKKHMKHPIAGQMLVEYSSLGVGDSPDMKLIVFTPLDGEGTPRSWIGFCTTEHSDPGGRAPLRALLPRGPAPRTAPDQTPLFPLRRRIWAQRATLVRHVDLSAWSQSGHGLPRTSRMRPPVSSRRRLMPRRATSARALMVPYFRPTRGNLLPWEQGSDRPTTPVWPNRSLPGRDDALVLAASHGPAPRGRGGVA